jgi:hypothetical protein
VKQNRDPQNRPTQIQSINLWQRSKDNSMEEAESSTKASSTTECQYTKIIIKLDPDLTQNLHIANSEWIIDPLIKHKAIKFPSDLAFNNEILDTSKAWSTK